MKDDLISALLFKKIPLVISVIFHPLLMPTLGIIILFHSGIPVSFISANSKNTILIVITLCTFCLPVALLPVFYYHSFLKQMNSENQHRFFPLLLISVSYYAGFYILHKMFAPSIIQLFTLASVIAVFITLIINLFWKISAHMVGIGGVVGIIVIIMMAYDVNIIFYLISTILIAGAIGTSRLSLNAHTPKQIYIGFLTGLLVMLGVFFIV